MEPATLGLIVTIAFIGPVLLYIIFKTREDL